MPSKTQQKTIDDIVSWTEIAARSGVSKNTLSQWYHRNHRGLRDAAVRPDMRPPLFLWSEVKPILDAAKTGQQ